MGNGDVSQTQAGFNCSVQDPKSGDSLSPKSLSALPAGATLVLPSPNGAALTAGFGSAGQVVAGCLRNATAVGAYIADVHSNVFDRGNGLVEPREQLRRAGQADTTVDTVAELDNALALRCHNDPPPRS